ncbi:hypothetical protein SAMN04515617_10853 [Collimonas sp. OK242]|nr:hypothetical protein SAMN04515617_10853 [Collimonas sp. OK242]
MHLDIVHSTVLRAAIAIGAIGAVSLAGWRSLLKLLMIILLNRVRQRRHDVCLRVCLKFGHACKDLHRQQKYQQKNQ